MRNLGCMIVVFLLLAWSAFAQIADQSSPAQSPASQATQPTATQPAAAQPAAASAPQTQNAPQPPAPGQSLAVPAPPPTTMDQVVDRAIERENALMKMLTKRTPLVETYLQNLKLDQQVGPAPVQDHYFLGRMDLSEGVDRRDYLSKDTSFESRMLGGFTKMFKFEYKPMGFSWMIFADRDDFNRQTYDFKYVHREFLGDVRTIVFDVTPKKGTGNGRFEGRIWVEDQDYNIVRLNGTYAPRPRNAYFFHMDSWRLNLIQGYWLPSYIYSEEGDFSYGSKDKMAFKAQTRLWGYNLQQAGKDSELTQVLVDSTVKDESAAAQDASPLQAQRMWQQQAEDNVVERLQDAGLLAPEGEVDKVLQTVVNNLLITNNIDLPRPVRTRVMLTSPLETFSVGNTIIVSRGLVDVLPDEACLAMVLSHELAHIVLGHNLGSKYAFTDRMLFSDESTYQNLGFRHVPEEEAAADKKAIDMLKNSPYSQKLGTAGLFLRQLQQRGPALSALLTPHLGNSFTDDKGNVTRMAALMTSAPQLDPNKLDQIAALPLGGRVKLNAWDDHVELIKSAPVAITSARDKMPLEVTPFFPRLTRFEAAAGPNAPASAANTAPSN
ncbi:MAG TPA: M48 family metalloprotease [Terriglobales bacterium]|nr:M48 family metalloprotease [Terriglobales bacterium]